MHQFRGLVAAEIKLLLKSRSFWVLAVFGVAGALLPTVGLLIWQLMAVATVKRDEPEGFLAIGVVLPCDTVKLFLARGLAVWVLLAGMWPLMVILLMCQSKATFAMGQLALLTVKYLVTGIVSIGLAFLVGVMVRHRWQLYLLTGLVYGVSWAFGSNLGWFPTWCTFLALGHGELLPVVPTLTVNIYPQLAFTLALALFQTGLAGLFIVGAAVRQMRRRREPVSRSSWLGGLVLVAGLILLVGGSYAWSELRERERSYRLSFQTPQPLPAGKQTRELTIGPRLAAYRLELNVHTAARFLEGKATIRMKGPVPASGLLRFALRSYFAVEQVFLVDDGGRLNYRRDASRLTVQIPKAYRKRNNLTLQINYSGKVWEWLNHLCARPAGLVNFITREYSVLRSGYAWYPIPGEHRLFRREFYRGPWDGSPQTALQAKRVPHSPVPFRLVVNLDSTQLAVTNLELDRVVRLKGKYQTRCYYRSERGQDLYLLVGPYRFTRKVFAGQPKPIPVYYFGQSSRCLDRVLRSVAEPYRFYETIFQPDGAESLGKSNGLRGFSVVEIPNFCDMFYGVNALVLKDTLLVGEMSFRYDAWRRVDCVAGSLMGWWPEDFTRFGKVRHGNIAEGLQTYLYVLYNTKLMQPGFYNGIKQSLLKGTPIFEEAALPYACGGPVVREVFMICDALRASGKGDQAIGQLMRQLYPIYMQKGMVSTAAFSKAVKTVMAQQKWSAPKAAMIHRRLRRIECAIRNPETWLTKPLFAGLIYGFDTITVYQ